MENNNFNLDNLHKKIKLSDLNKIRLKIYNEINNKDWISNLMYNLYKIHLDEIVGNELAIQKKVNVSIQIPRDNSSLIPMHSDFFSGESIFQVNLWLPLVDVKKTNSMFLKNFIL